MPHTPHLYLPGPWTGPTIAADDRVRHHVGRVLRRPPGTEVSYTDGRGVLGVGMWHGDAVTRGRETTASSPEMPVFAVAAPRTAERRRFLVEKLAELGVPQLRWLRTSRAALRLSKPEKTLAWCIAALEQSRGAHLMDVGGPVDWGDLARPLVVADRSGSAFAAQPAATIAVGPEGGFHDDEVPVDATPVTLGERILRVETAAVVFAGLVTSLRA